MWWQWWESNPLALLSRPSVGPDLAIRVHCHFSEINYCVDSWKTAGSGDEAALPREFRPDVRVPSTRRVTDLIGSSRKALSRIVGLRCAPRDLVIRSRSWFLRLLLRLCGRVSLRDRRLGAGDLAPAPHVRGDTRHLVVGAVAGGRRAHDAVGPPRLLPLAPPTPDRERVHEGPLVVRVRAVRPAVGRIPVHVVAVSVRTLREVLEHGISSIKSGPEIIRPRRKDKAAACNPTPTYWIVVASKLEAISACPKTLVVILNAVKDLGQMPGNSHICAGFRMTVFGQSE
ncbi:MAG: hypothetical protein UX98_C0011G0001 [Parcubacteria group bacterium GW2011_GWA2_47_26]|nr:MAG: hypothetical protein UX98_C0011G0001 [Parcubacteria group bacterium GW2011_GWA2_47_26]